jgi:DNA polymerase-3 subunit epsilon
MHELIGVALRDRRLSEAERADLEQVRGLLCIPDDEFKTMLSEATTRIEGHASTAPRKPSEEFEGKTICFTGELRSSLNGEPIERSYAQQVAESHGMIVKSGVSKALDFLVIADPDSMSGKAKKAREYGTRIVAEPVFWQMMGIDVD